MQLDQATMNIIGLVLNMVGVVIIFFFGPPQPSFKEGIAIGLEDETPIDSSGKTVATHNQEIKKKHRYFLSISKAGLIIIFAGFAFQLCAVFLQNV